MLVTKLIAQLLWNLHLNIPKVLLSSVEKYEIHLEILAQNMKYLAHLAWSCYKTWRREYTPAREG